MKCTLCIGLLGFVLVPFVTLTGQEDSAHKSRKNGFTMKEKALAKVTPTGSTFKRFRPNDNLLAFLASL
jgi:hypothetical protein